MAPAIELRSVVKDYGRVRALRGIDLTVDAGQIFGFLGPNGAGKTTTIRILLDLIRPTSGTAHVLGLDSQRDTVEVRRRSGYLPGDLRMYEGLRGSAFLDLIDSFRPRKRDPQYRRELLERLELDPSMPIRALSKGNKQKMGLVQALMHRPDVLILDEPTSGLDPLVQQEVAKLLEEAAASGRTVFFSSHVLPEVERLSHAVAIIRRARSRRWRTSRDSSRGRCTCWRSPSRSRRRPTSSRSRACASCTATATPSTSRLWTASTRRSRRLRPITSSTCGRSSRAWRTSSSPTTPPRRKKERRMRYRLNVVEKSLRDQKWQIVGFGIALLAMAALIVYIWPSYRTTVASIQLAGGGAGDAGQRPRLFDGRRLHQRGVL